MNQTFRQGAFFLMIFTFLSCAKPVAPNVNELSPLGAGEIILSGKVEIFPPLSQDLARDMAESTILSRSYEKTGHKVQLFFADQLSQQSESVFSERRFVEATLGDLFFARVPANSFYVLGVDFSVSEAGESREQHVRMSGNYHVDVQKEDQVVYIGTLRLFRNDENQVDKAQLLDESRSAKKEVARGFGGGVRFRKSLLTVVPAGNPNSKIIPLEGAKMFKETKKN